MVVPPSRQPVIRLRSEAGVIMGVKRGREGIRETFRELLADPPSADWDVPTQIFEGDLLFIEWSAVSEKTRLEDGIDTVVFRDGLIRAQTVRYTLIAK